MSEGSTGPISTEALKRDQIVIPAAVAKVLGRAKAAPASEPDPQPGEMVSISALEYARLKQIEETAGLYIVGKLGGGNPSEYLAHRSMLKSLLGL